MSHESLTSFEAKQELKAVQVSDPVFYADIISGQHVDAVPSYDGAFPEDAIAIPHAEDADLDSTVQLREVVSNMESCATAAEWFEKEREELDNTGSDLDDEEALSDRDERAASSSADKPSSDVGIKSQSRSESPGDLEPAEPDEMVADGRRSTRRRVPNRRYNNAEWVRYDESSDRE